MERRAPCTHSSEPACPGYTLRLRSACPDHPLCSLGPGADSSRRHSRLECALSTAEHQASPGPFLPERIGAPVPAAWCLTAALTSVTLTPSLARPLGSFWEETRLSGTPSRAPCGEALSVYHTHNGPLRMFSVPEARRTAQVSQGKAGHKRVWLWPCDAP